MCHVDVAGAHKQSTLVATHTYTQTHSHTEVSLLPRVELRMMAQAGWSPAQRIVAVKYGGSIK